MWNRDRVWMHYVKNIVAADMSSAVFLASYLRRIGITRDYAATLEVYDLQRYRVIRNTLKVKVALKEKRNKPFIFVAGKN